MKDITSGIFKMKSYSEFLRGYISKNGTLLALDVGGCYGFRIEDKGNEKLVDVGMDYAEFSTTYGCQFIPLSLLVVTIKRKD
jgi:hypothetical protein